MKIKITALAAVFAAGMTASFAFAHDGPGKGDDHAKGKSACKPAEFRGTIAPQTLNVTVSKGFRRLNVTPGTQVQVQVGAAGQTVSVEGVACQVVSGTSTVLQVKELKVKVRTPKTTTTTTTATTGSTTTSG